MSQLPHSVKILQKENFTHDVVHCVFERPEGYKFTAGQAIDVNIDNTDGDFDDAPFTFTGLEEDPNLELMFKVYPSHHGTTLALSHLQAGDRLRIGDPFDTFAYKGQGVFIAGGTGITPFVALLRDLDKKNKLDGNRLIFANKTSDDLFLQDELKSLLKDNLVQLLSREDKPGFFHGRVTADFLKTKIPDIHAHFYLCGPDGFSKNVKTMLVNLGADENKIMVEY